MTLSEDEIKHIALLGRIGIKDDEVAGYQKNLSATFDFFQELNQVPTEGVEPIRHITGSHDVVREDHLDEWSESGKKKIHENLPDSKDNYLKVRSVF